MLLLRRLIVLLECGAIQGSGIVVTSVLHG